ncbi:MAG: gamma carbonic anhydrase family protein [Candidatus Rokubacteria bacterium]|nr:gamma carbonic anhydrase family protein [Candidatus Rokubacteria bacterium]
MIFSHRDVVPTIDPTAWVAPDATVCGDVHIGANTRVMHGARVIAEAGQIRIGQYCVVMENAVIRSTARHSADIGDHCLIGPNAHLVGCSVEDEVFLATGVAVFHGARLGRGAEVRINGVVHLRSHLPAGTTVPIGWVAVGSPIRIFPPDKHDEIWGVQKPLNFPLYVYGFDRGEADMRKITTRLCNELGEHRNDAVSGDL